MNNNKILKNKYVIFNSKVYVPLLQVEIQMADHPLSDDAAIFDVYFSAKVDDIIAVSKYINFHDI